MDSQQSCSNPPLFLRQSQQRPRHRRAGHAAGAAMRAEAAGRPRRVCRTFAPKAKRVIYLFQSGGPSQMDCSITSRS